MIKDQSLKDDLIMQIAKHFPYSIKDVKYVYSITNSIDATIKTCEASRELGYGDPTIIIGQLKK